MIAEKKKLFTLLVRSCFYCNNRKINKYRWGNFLCHYCSLISLVLEFSTMVGQAHEYEVILQIVAFISVTSSVIVLFNLLALYLSQYGSGGQDFTLSLLYQVLAFISLGDMLGNASYLSEERPSDGSLDCNIEGFLNIFAYPVSWLWTLYLTYVLYYLAVHEVMIDKMKVAYFVCWGVPLAFAFGQIWNGGFGRHDNETYDMCTSAGGYRSTLYHRVTYYGLLFVCIVAMMSMRVKMVYLQYYLKDPCTLTESFRVATKTLGFYPLVMMICWIPHGVVRSLNHVSNTWHLFGLCLKIAHGFLLACTYFYSSPPSRRIFWKTLSPLFWFQLLVRGNDRSLEMSMDFFDGILNGRPSGAKDPTRESAPVTQENPLRKPRDTFADQEMVNIF